ncbi:hypothetical protein K438DRAFT_606734 [Mycena galopus ATCC 62051]|nr:hypothetical protein K438DRAFT_606734 [Mycena galopus ATCC 62051]
MAPGRCQREDRAVASTRTRQFLSAAPRPSPPTTLETAARRRMPPGRRQQQDHAAASKRAQRFLAAALRDCSFFIRHPHSITEGTHTQFSHFPPRRARWSTVAGSEGAEMFQNHKKTTQSTHTSFLSAAPRPWPPTTLKTAARRRMPPGRRQRGGRRSRVDTHASFLSAAPRPSRPYSLRHRDSANEHVSVVSKFGAILWALPQALWRPDATPLSAYITFCVLLLTLPLLLFLPLLSTR